MRRSYSLSESRRTAGALARATFSRSRRACWRAARSVHVSRGRADAHERVAAAGALAGLAEASFEQGCSLEEADPSEAIDRYLEAVARTRCTLTPT